MADTDKLLDRDLAIALTHENTSKAGPALRAVVDEGLGVFERCAATAQEKDVHVGALFSLLHLCEMLDGVEVALDASAIVPAKVLLRSAFEALLTLEYLTEEDVLRRGAAYMVAEVQARIRDHKKWDPSTGQGGALRADLKKDKYGFSVDIPAVEDSDEKIQGLKEMLKADHLKEAAEEYERVRARFGRTPPFYALFDGPSDIEQLARHLGRSGQYAILYRTWSQTAHAVDLRRQLTEEDGLPAVRVLRDPRDMLPTYSLAMSLGLAAIRQMLETYRFGEIERGSHRDWYEKEVKGVYNALTDATAPDEER